MTSLTRCSALIALLASTACAVHAADLSHHDKRYLDKTAEGLMAEVEMGHMAQKQAEDAGVKAFGKRMVNDHGKDLEELKQIASKKDVKLPDSPSHKQKSEADKLSKLTGKDFDREYVQYETKDHQEDIKDQAKEMKDTSDADLKKFATAAHSTVTEHYKMVEDLHGKIGK
jgi:putative membrane protein